MSCFNLFGNIFKSQENPPPEQMSVDQIQTTPPLNQPFPIPKSIPDLYKKNEHNLRVFTYQELINATCGFNRSLKIGEGGFGSVYRGKMKLSSNTPRTIDVAVKKLNKNGLQGHKEWLSEVQFLGVVSHPNLVKLLGYCNEDDERDIQRLLVYEYMPNRSFEDHLFGRTYPTLSWKTRLNIILGAAEGLAYLHTGMEVQVIYRDFKASNVLLDEDLKPKLSDFGLAREGPSEGQTHVSTKPVGTFGYAAPEYVETGHLKAESDVWGFGVVLYELLTGRRALDRSRPVGEQKLLVWVKRFPVDSKMFAMVIDPKIMSTMSVEGARIVARLADACLSRNPKDRPSMVQVVDTIKLAIRESEFESDSAVTGEGFF